MTIAAEVFLNTMNVMSLMGKIEFKKLSDDNETLRRKLFSNSETAKVQNSPTSNEMQ